MTTDLVDEKIEHRVTVNWDRSIESYRAACSCGWLDVMHPGWRPHAVERAEQHLANT